MDSPFAEAFVVAAEEVLAGPATVVGNKDCCCQEGVANTGRLQMDCLVVAALYFY